MKKLLLSLIAIACGNFLFAQDLSNCKKTCEVQKVIETGAFLGVRIVPTGQNKYVRVAEVVPNTSASSNNFAQNDIITKIDRIDIIDNPQVIKIIDAHQPNDVIKITFIRNGQTLKKRVALGAKSTKLVTETICCDEPAQPTTTNNLVAGGVNFKLYPNPAMNTLQINSDARIDGEVEINVFDLIGNRVINKVINDHQDALNQKLDLTTLSNGTYLVKIMNNDLVSVSKLVVRK